MPDTQQPQFRFRRKNVYKKWIVRLLVLLLEGDIRRLLGGHHYYSSSTKHMYAYKYKHTKHEE